MRKAEFIMALVLGVFSAYLMWKSAELPIGWEQGIGPGGGMFPFWLSTGMLICCVWILVRWVRRTSPPSQSEEPYMDHQTAVLIGLVVGSLTLMIGAIHLVGVYGAIPLFFIWYMRTLGRHSWTESISLALITPVVTFFFFEILLHITLPKGYLEPLFYPLFDLFL
jgi:hypothetical protein